MNALICLIPHYNNPEGLAASLASIGPQEQCDVLVVDDGSTQKPLDEAAARAAFQGQGNIHFLRQPQNRGIEHALNAGLQWIMQQGYELVGRLDCGDLNMPERFALQRAFLETHPQVMLLGGAAAFVDMQGQTQFITRHPVDHASIRKAFYANSVVIHPTVVFRSKVLDSVGLYPTDVRAAEDYSFFWNIAERFPVANLPDILIRYELNPGSISLSRRGRQLRSRLKVQWQHRSLHPRSWLGLLRTLMILIIPYKLLFRLKAFCRRGAA